jgi:hypothetical protein
VLFSSWISLALFLPSYGLLFSAGELPQAVFGKHATVEFDPFSYHQTAVFALLADCR